ncbi:RodZ domain-containing protein [Oceanobacillus sp. Castelsardo]|uniref:helix-turn-helix domain-containing protein n=1 Tax=Oceanobacillus sp. Castelsardo TaxID=1851204 RepID=UPI000838826F|nr:RodZ domain-containing protein [Oceanobacillus sp. Castelsardo]
MDIGARLKEARVSKGLSLDELQEITKIQKRYLAAIEEGKLEILPGKFYARAFIKEYADAVGIEPSELLEEHKEEIPETKEESSPAEYSRMQRSKKESVEKNSKLFSAFPTVIVILLILAIVFVIWFFSGGLNNGDNNAKEDKLDETEIIINNPNDEDKKDSAIEDNKTNEDSRNSETDSEEIQEDTNKEGNQENESQPELTVVEEGSGSSPKSTLELSNVGEEINLVFETNSRTWLDVKDDQDQSLFSSTLEAENSPLELDLSGSSKIFLNIGNASDLKVTINGMELEYPVDANKYVHQQLWININNQEIE